MTRIEFNRMCSKRAFDRWFTSASGGDKGAGLLYSRLNLPTLKEELILGGSKVAQAVHTIKKQPPQKCILFKFHSVRFWAV